MQRCRRLGTYAGVYVLMTAVPTIRWNEALDREQQAPRRSTFREGVYRIESNQGNEEVHTKPSSSSPAVPFNLPAHYHPPHHPQPRFTRASRPPPGHGPAAGSCTCPGAWAAAPASGPSSRAPPPPPRPHTAPVAVDLGVGGISERTIPSIECNTEPRNGTYVDPQLVGLGRPVPAHGREDWFVCVL